MSDVDALCRSDELFQSATVTTSSASSFGYAANLSALGFRGAVCHKVVTDSKAKKCTSLMGGATPCKAAIILYIHFGTKMRTFEEHDQCVILCLPSS